MKIKLIILFISLSSCLHLSAQEDSLSNRLHECLPSGHPTTHTAYRQVVRSTMIGAGFANVFDTYLSPLEYKGADVRFLLENIRMTGLMNGRVSVQHLFQVSFDYTKNPNKSVKSYSGLINWSYALHYQKEYSKRLKILVGPMLDINGGVIYNQRNSNNPAQAKAYASLGGSAMAIYKFSIGRSPFTLRYQANLPLLGIMFSPEYGESYYEIFGLGNGGKNVICTSLHNMPSLRQMLTLDCPIKNTILRIGYLCDIQQSKVNNLKSHTYSHDFMIGVVRNLYFIKGKKKANFHKTDSPY